MRYPGQVPTTQLGASLFRTQTGTHIPSAPAPSHFLHWPLLPPAAHHSAPQLPGLPHTHPLKFPRAPSSGCQPQSPTLKPPSIPLLSWTGHCWRAVTSIPLHIAQWGDWHIVDVHQSPDETWIKSHPACGQPVVKCSSSKVLSVDTHRTYPLQTRFGEDSLIAEVNCINLKYCSASTPPGSEIVSSLTSLKGREHKRLCSLGPGTGLEWDLCPLQPPSTLPTSPQPLPVLRCSKEAQEVASSPWKRMHMLTSRCQTSRG